MRKFEKIPQIELQTEKLREKVESKSKAHQPGLRTAMQAQRGRKQFERALTDAVAEDGADDLPVVDALAEADGPDGRVA